LIGSGDECTFRATDNPLGEVFEQIDAVLTADPRWMTRKIAAGHDVMIDRPEETRPIDTRNG